MILTVLCGRYGIYEDPRNFPDLSECLDVASMWSVGLGLDLGFELSLKKKDKGQ